MHKDFEKVLVTKEQISTRITELATAISTDYKDKKPLFVCILKGSIIFYADLIRKMTVPCQLDFIQVSSYGSGTTTGKIKLLKDLDNAIEGRDVIIVEDIVDSGKTLSYLKELLGLRKPNSIKICTLLDKPERREVALEADYCGFVIPNEFVVGYGLDYDENYREFDQIYILKPEVYM
ncbi:MAG: hypoxanthine phosphoribosyltransferase [Clostridia bacterium]|nr:hypoxanthine phosphoribosyltransferase [Clostridia bacterium]